MNQQAQTPLIEMVFTGQRVLLVACAIIEAESGSEIGMRHRFKPRSPPGVRSSSTYSSETYTSTNSLLMLSVGRHNALRRRNCSSIS